MSDKVLERTSRQKLRDELLDLLGPQGLLEGEAIGPRYYEDISQEREGRPWLVVRPRCTSEVSAVLKRCWRAGQSIIPQGGMTGLVSAGTPIPDEIVLASDRMTVVEEIDPDSVTMTVQCGVPLQTVQEQADAHGFLFPLDIGARGSCTVGGNLSTNAGGNRVIRYGMMRDLVLGVEAVLADGTVVGNLHKLPKNNAGYDLKHLFIGTEGTLGFITRAVLRLQARPRSQQVAWCALEGFPQAIRLLRQLRERLGGQLSAFEALWGDSYRLIVDRLDHVKAPLDRDHPFYVLVESLGGDTVADAERFEVALNEAVEDGIIVDAVIAKSGAEVEEFWGVRDGIAEVVLGFDPFLSYDVSMPVGQMEAFAEEVLGEIARRWPDAVAGVFGHIGDGNLHIVTDVGEDGITKREEVDELVYRRTASAEGSISAEHGIGFQKRDHLSLTRSPQEIALMRQLKRALDPKGILSPGRIFEAG